MLYREVEGGLEHQKLETVSDVHVCERERERERGGEEREGEERERRERVKG